MKSFKLKDKVVLVTGANRGIGEAFVKTAIEEGAKKVFATARDVNNLTTLSEQYPDTVVALQLDVTNSEHIASLSQKVAALDVLINNAGIASGCFFTDDNALEIAREEMETNFFGSMQVALALLPQLKESAQAAIVNISSIAGISNLAALGPYSATKAAVHSFTQGLRAELMKDKVSVVGVYPGPIDTRMAEGFEMDKPQPEQVARKTFEALAEGRVDVLPDDFSEQMYTAFLHHPHELEKAFAEMQ